MRTKKHLLEAMHRPKVSCSGCGVNITLHNSATASHSQRVSKPRCGPCYLKFRAELRKQRGLE